VVDDLDNRRQLASVLVLIVEHNDPADLDQRPLRTLDVELGHCEEVCGCA
jgi:hypothetical protein